MAFLKSSLNFAERFLDVLDDKGENSTKTKASEGQSGEKPAFTRRSASFVTQQAETSDVAPPSPGFSRRSGSGSSQPMNSDSIPPETVGTESSQGNAVLDGTVSSMEGDVSRSGVTAAVTTSSIADSGQSSDVFEHTSTRRSRRDSATTDSEGTVSALLSAIQEKDARIVQLTMQNETFKRQNADLSADLDDMEAELRRVQDDAEKARKSVHGLEQQVKDAYAEVLL
jgi:hypothetical protein